MKRYIKAYSQPKFDVHYLKYHPHCGFNGSSQLDMPDIYCTLTEFEDVLGEDPENAKYAAFCTQYDFTSHLNSGYKKVLFTNNINEAEDFVDNWINDNHERGRFEVHYYGTVVDLIDGKEVTYKDSWR